MTRYNLQTWRDLASALPVHGDIVNGLENRGNLPSICLRSRWKACLIEQSYSPTLSCQEAMSSLTIVPQLHMLYDEASFTEHEHKF